MMAQFPPAGWYRDPDGGGAPRWWDGHSWAAPQAPVPNARRSSDARSSRIVIAATVAGVALFFAVIGAVTGGIGGFLSILGLSALVVGIIAVAKGGIASLAIRNRALGGAVLAAGFVVMFTGGGVGAATSPRPVALVEVGSERDATHTTPSPTATTVMTEIVETQAIPFESVTVDDPSSPSGTSVVSVVGVDGVLTLTYRITSTDGIETGREKVSEVVTTAPIAQVTSVGSRVDRLPVAAAPSGGCDPNYTPCVPIASDVDCAGGSGNGPAYVNGPVTVIGNDIYDLDRDGDGTACE
jgi:resuscitation-promoting factor RpfB